jgi:hypothetical protein
MLRRRACADQADSLSSNSINHKWHDPALGS